MKTKILVLLVLTMICLSAYGQSQTLSGQYAADDEDSIYQFFEFTEAKSTVRAAYKIEGDMVIITNSKGETIELEIEDNKTLVGYDGFGLEGVTFIKAGTMPR